MFESYLKPPISFPTITGSIVTFNSQYAGLPLKSHTVDIDSVSGVSAINISAMGKNLFNKDAVTLGKWITETGTEHNTTNGAYSSYIPIITNIPYYFSHIVGNSSFYSIAVYDEDKIFIEIVNILGGNDSSRTITFTKGSYIRVNVYKKYLDIVQVELGSSPTDYEAYNGNTYTIQIGTSVNEGEYNARTGVMEVTQPSVQTLQLPPCPIDTLEGVNNIFADTGDTTLQYIKFG